MGFFGSWGQIKRSAAYFKSTRAIVLGALFIAIGVGLTRLAAIHIGDWLRISFGFLPIAIAGMAFGPFFGMACGGMADLIGSLLFPTGPYFPGYTLSAMLTGLVYGLALYRREIRIYHIAVAVVVVNLGVHLCLNTYWYSLISGKAWMAMALPRAVKNLAQCPVDILLLWWVTRSAHRLLPSFARQFENGYE